MSGFALYVWMLCRLVVYGAVPCQCCLSPYFLKQIWSQQHLKWPSGGKSGLCPRWCTFHTFCPHYFLVDGLFCSRVLFQHIFIIAVPCRSQTHHLAPLLKPWKSKLCLWITIHQNKFPLQPPQEALIREENLFSLYFLHFWPCFWSTGEPGLYLVCPFFYQTEGYNMHPFSLSRHLKTERDTLICLSMCVDIPSLLL